MKKLLIFLPILFLVTFVFSNNLSLFSHSKKVDKEIHLSIFSNSNYNASVYDNDQAIIEVTVSKMDKNKIVIINKQSYKALQLKQYPSAANAISKNVKVNATFNGDELLLITYTITYNSNGSILSFQNSEVVNKDTENDNINIKI